MREELSDERGTTGPWFSWNKCRKCVMCHAVMRHLRLLANALNVTGEWRDTDGGEKEKQDGDEKQTKGTWRNVVRVFYWLEIDQVTRFALSTNLFFHCPLVCSFDGIRVVSCSDFFVSRCTSDKLHMSKLRCQHPIIHHCQHLSKTIKTHRAGITDEHATGRGLARCHRLMTV